MLTSKGTRHRTGEVSFSNQHGVKSLTTGGRLSQDRLLSISSYVNVTNSGCQSMATRIEQLARPKPSHLKWPDRRSVYWLDELPGRRRGGPTTFELTPRWLALCDGKPPRAGFQDNRRPPVWEVTAAALRGAPSERVCSLAQPRLPVQGWQPGRPLLAKPKPSARSTVPSSRVCELACPRKTRPPSLLLGDARPSLSGLRTRTPSTRIHHLAVPKLTHPQYQQGRPVSWPVLGPAREAVASDRVQVLAQPKLRKVQEKGYDPFTVRPAACRASATPRVLELSEPLPRKRWQK
ncbi:sperm microtubule associated protein 2 isoform X1 [Anguilla rostrata]|uniref:sperm microtubule associated protein 2 isoform X1 n=2 Tax=Anguilla rostrata TaxID=7938 RepID=UPI0030D55A84